MSPNTPCRRSGGGVRQEPPQAISSYEVSKRTLKEKPSLCKSHLVLPVLRPQSQPASVNP